MGSAPASRAQPRMAHFMLLVLLANPPAAAAQSPTASDNAATTWVGPQVVPLLGLHWDRLQLVTLSGGAGMLWCRMPEGLTRPLCGGSYLLLSQGWYGGEFSLGGIAVSTAWLASLAADVSLLRTRNDPPRVATQATYVGPRLRLVRVPIGVSIGWYRRLGGGAGTEKTAWTLSVGVGMP